MTAKDFHALVNVGDTIRVICDGETITGRVLLMLEETIQLLRTDTNAKRAVAISTIDAVEFVAPTPAAGPAGPKPAPAPAPAGKPGTAPQGTALPQQDDGRCHGRIMTYFARSNAGHCFGFIKCSYGTDPSQEYHFRLSQVKSPELYNELMTARVLRSRWRVSYDVESSENGLPEAIDIRLEDSDVQLLTRMEPPVVKRGVLVSKSTIQTGANTRCFFYTGAVRDDLLYMLLRQDEPSPHMEVYYMLSPGRRDKACAVWLVEEELDKLVDRFRAQTPEPEKKIRANLLLSAALNEFSEQRPRPAALTFTVKEQEPVPAASKAAGPKPPAPKPAAPKPAAPKPAPKATPESAASKAKPDARKFPPLEEEQQELKRLLALAEDHFKDYTLIESEPGADLCQLGRMAAKEGDTSKAEQYLYKALVTNDRPEEALGALLSSYVRTSDRQTAKEQVARGLFLLEKYKALCTDEKYAINRVNMLEKGGFGLLLVNELDSVLKVILRPSTRMHYCNRAGHILFRCEKYEQALEYFEQWGTTREQYAEVLGIADRQDNKYAAIERDLNQCLAVCYNMTGQPERARQIAESLLQEDSNNAVARKIMEGRLDKETAQEAGSFDDDGYDYLSEGELEITPYARYCFENAEMQQVRNKALTLQGQIRGNDYFGTPSQAMHDIGELGNTNFLRRLTMAQRKGYWGMAAKIVAQTIQNYHDNTSLLKRNYLFPNRIWEKIAHCILCGGDDIVLSAAGSMESAQFLYTESLPLFLPKNSDRRRAFACALGTALLSRNDMRTMIGGDCSFEDILRLVKNCKDPNLADNLLSVTFQVDGKYLDRGKERANMLEQLCSAIYANDCLRGRARELFAEMGVVPSDLRDPAGAFNADWRSAKESYVQQKEELIQCLHRTVEDVEYPQKLTDDITQIQEHRRADLLCSLDKHRLDDFCRGVLEPLVNLKHKDSFEQKRQDYENARRACERIIGAIYANPTKLSFDELIGVLESITGSIAKAMDELYQRSEPELELALTADTAYVDELNPYARIEIAIQNMANRQPSRLDKMEVTVIGADDCPAEPQGKLALEVRGGERASQGWLIRLQPAQLAEHSFDIEVKLYYSYFSRPRTEESKVKTAQFNISLANAAEFEEVINNYASIREGSDVGDAMFYGRNEYIRNLVASLRDANGNMICRRGIVMYGQKRAGKTTILNHLTARIKETYGPDTYLIVSVGSVGASGSLIGFLSSMMDHFEMTLEDEYPHVYQALMEKGVNFRVEDIERQETAERAEDIFTMAFRRIDRVLQELGGTQKYIPLFLLDEFTYFYDWIVNGKVDADFMLFWKAFHQEYRICTIAVAMDSMPEFVRYIPPKAVGNFTNSFACLRLEPVGYLDRAAVKELADKPTRLHSGKSRFQEDALDYIYELTAGSAYLAVILCDELVNYVNDNKTVRISRTVIDLVLENRLFRGGKLTKDNFDPQINDPGVFGSQGQAVWGDNMVILSYIAQYCDPKGYELSRTEFSDCVTKLSVPEDARLDRLLTRLTARDVLECRSSNGINSYKIKVDLLRRWLKYKNGMED